MFKNHPRGLTVLFFTEMWERFGYYLMLGIFTLYMIDPSSSGGMGFSDFKAADIYGTYLALVYLTPFVGGLLADRILGYRKAIAIGGALMGTGYIGLAIPGQAAFFISLLIIIDSPVCKKLMNSSPPLFPKPEVTSDLTAISFADS